MIEAGNIDLANRPRVQNADGSVSTVRSMSANIDGAEVLLPTVSDDGSLMTSEQAIQQYQQTGRHMGKFKTPEEATAYAQLLHEQQARMTESVSPDWVDRLSGQQTNQSLLRDLRNPPKTDTSFNAFSFGMSGLKGIPAGGLEMAGSWADLLSGFATPYAATHGDEQARQKMLTEGSFDFEAGNVLRSKAEQFSPDPMTAHKADQVMFGLTRGVSKAVGYMASMGGLPGAVAFGADEGNTAAQRLMQKGVDPVTAAQIGGVTGVAAGLGAGLPLKGATPVETLMLAIFGGPGLYAAQEKIARDVLQRQYPQEAQTHDPSDPLGLALSMVIPGIATGLHLHGLKSEKDIRDAVQLTPAEAAKEADFERSAGNIQELQSAIKAEKNPENKAILEKELATLTKQAKAHVDERVTKAANDPEIVDAARVKVQEAQLREVLPETPTSREQVLQAADTLGAGEHPTVAPVRDIDMPQFRAWFGESKVVDAEGTPLVVYRGAKATNEDIATPAWFSTSSATADVYAGSRAPLDRELLPQDRIKDGSQVQPVYLSVKSPASVDFATIANATSTTIDRYRAQGHDGLSYTNAKTGERWVVPFDSTQIKSAIGNSGKFDPNSASLTDPLRPGEASPRQPNNLPPAGQMLEPEKAPAEGLPSLDSARIQALAKELPDLRVTIPGHEPMSLTEALATAQEEAAALKQFGELVKAAAECALTQGGL